MLRNGPQTVAAVCLAISAGLAQGERPCTPRSQVLLSPDRASVYFSFERLAIRSKTSPRLAESVPGRNKSDRNDLTRDTADSIILRLRNNTCWTIGFPTESFYVGPAVTAWSFCDGTVVLGLRDGVEVNGRYEVEELASPPNDRPARRLSVGRTDVFATSWLPPGRSVIVAVSKGDLNKGFGIYLPFNYEWEAENGHVREEKHSRRGQA